MKLFLMFSLSTFVLTSVTFAETVKSSTTWDKPNYPTELIGDFMQFCISAMNMKQMQKGNMNQAVVNTHARVCSCVMDTFRMKNNESTFRQEFKAARLGDVPNFRKYLRQCGEISNNQNMLKYGT